MVGGRLLCVKKYCKTVKFKYSHQQGTAEEEKCLFVMTALWGDVYFLSIRQGSCRRSCIISSWLNSMSWRPSVAMEKIANYRASLHFPLLLLPLIINHFDFFALNNEKNGSMIMFTLRCCNLIIAVKFSFFFWPRIHYLTADWSFQYVIFSQGWKIHIYPNKCTIHLHLKREFEQKA